MENISKQIASPFLFQRLSMRPFCLELVREAVPHGGRGAEIHRGHEEPGHAANSAYLSLTRNVYRCSMCDWLKVKLICLVQLPEGSR